MLRAEKLCFARGGARLRDVSFQLAPGQLMKITGDNGSGKSTLLKLLALLLPADSGALHWREKPAADDADAYREELLYIGHSSGLAAELTPRENLRAAAGLRLRPPACPLPQALAAAGLAAEGDRLCRYLSAGQRRRAALARLQAFQARLWLLDEPLAALDADGRAMLSQWLQAHLAAGGMAISTMHRAEDWDVEGIQLAVDKGSQQERRRCRL